MAKVDWASTQEAVDLVEAPGDEIEFDDDGNIIRNTFTEQKEAQPQQGAEEPDEDEDNTGEDQDEPMTAQVSSNPPDRTDSEQGFSEWLHSHPVHETDDEWDQLTLGQGKMHTPKSEDDGEEVENADAKSTDSGQQNPGSDQSGGEESQDGNEDYSYLDEWGRGKKE
jgi:hypothetical protein